MRQQGIDLLSREGQQYKANAVTMADARLEIERQNAAYQSAQQAGGSMIDSLVTGTGTLIERLKSMATSALEWFNQMAVANPLKNALTGTNLPTLGDLFSGKPSIAGNATSTATMTDIGAFADRQHGRREPLSSRGVRNAPVDASGGSVTQIAQVALRCSLLVLPGNDLVCEHIGSVLAGQIIRKLV
jgi:hypothetical protein